MAPDLQAIFTNPKTVPVAPTWVAREGAFHGKWLTLIAPLDIAGVTQQGLQLRLTAVKSMPDCQVTGQIECHLPRGKGGPLARVDWRPLHSHNNHGAGPAEWRFKIMSGSHHHAFALNWAHSEAQVKQGKLPIAVPLAPDPADFQMLLEFLEKQFNINSLASIPIPPWEAELV